MNLIVKTPFLDHQLGDIIEHNVEQILESYPQFVVAIKAAPKAEPEQPIVDAVAALPKPEVVIAALKSKSSNKKDN